MKFIRALLYLSLFVFLSCNNRASRVDKPQLIDTSAKVEAGNKIDKSKYYTTHDTLAIPTELGFTLKYGKEEFNEIIDSHPELTDDYTQEPDYVYHCNGDSEGFNSEAGQDNYYILYAYLLKNKNGDEKYSAIRRKLIDIYSNINSLFAHFEHGGTYFGHQGVRILGYAEYSVYLYKLNKAHDLSKTYDITKQKELYIKSLRQLISDENSIDFDTLEGEKMEQTKKLNKIVDDIERAITNNYFLRRAQEFHYSHYEYY
jgi:hypothetical protein